MKITNGNRVSSHGRVLNSLERLSSQQIAAPDAKPPGLQSAPVINNIKKDIYAAIDDLFYKRGEDGERAFERLSSSDQEKFTTIIENLERRNYAIPQFKLPNASPRGAGKTTSGYDRRGKVMKSS